MLKKFLLISCFLSLMIIAFNTSYVVVYGDEVRFEPELENQVPQLFDKGIMICKEVADLSNFNTINLVNNWYSNLAEENDFSGVGLAMKNVVFFFSFLLLPVDLGLNLIKFTFNCFNILVGNKIQIQPNTSFGGGGGGFSGGR